MAGLVGCGQRAVRKHFHGDGHGVVEFRAGRAWSQMSEAVFDQVCVGGEVLKLVYGVVEAHHGGFTGWPHDGLGEENAGLAYLGKEGFDAGTGLEQDDNGDWIAAKIEVGNPLGYAVVGDLEIAGFQIVDHFAAAIAHGHGHIYQRHPHFDRGLADRRWLLDFDSGFRRKRTDRSLRAGKSFSQRQQKSQS